MELNEIYNALSEVLTDVKLRLDKLEKNFNEKKELPDLDKNHLLARLKLNLNNEGEHKNPVDDERIEKGRVVIADQEPVTYHTITRKKCEYKVIQREIHIHPEINTSKLTFKEAITIEFTASGSIKAQIEAALKVKATAELLSAWQAITGSPIPTAVRIGASVEASVAASMSAQIVLNVNIRIIRYTYIVEGVLLARLVARTKELWDWVGEDCDELGIHSNPKIQEYEVKDADYKELPIEPLHFVFWEITSPSITILGLSWAVNERNKEFREKLQQSWESGALRTLPLPQFMPDPL